MIDVFCRKLNTPTTVGNAVKIATPTYDWEKIGANVNEGPGMYFLAYKKIPIVTGFVLQRSCITAVAPL